MFNLTDKIAVVTGAGSGIGAAIARALAQHGALVYVAELNPDTGPAVAAEIVALGRRAHALPLDVADPASVRACAAAVLADHGRCDVLVNNAGVGSIGTALTTTEAD